MQKQKKEIDKSLVVITLLLTVLGLVAVADASAPQALAVFSDSYYFVKQQAVWGLLGILLMFVASRIHYSFWRRLAPLFFVGSLGLLVAVLVPGLGTKVLGARRWLSLGSVSFQPSEVVKLTLALFLAYLSEKRQSLVPSLVSIVLVAALIMIQPDLGTTIVVVAIGIAQLFIMGIPLLALGGIIGSGAVASLLLIIISDYRRARLLTFFKSSVDPLGSSYHIRQVLIAMGSGGLFGVGLGQSRQKYLFLPEAATDSVFAVVAEEVGFIGSTLLVVLLSVFIYKLIKVALAAPDNFSMVASGGIIVWIGGQMLLNIGSMVALVPLTGIPLPFFSYGGTNLTMVLFGVGILLNISKHKVAVSKTRKPRVRYRQ